MPQQGSRQADGDWSAAAVDAMMREDEASRAVGMAVLEAGKGRAVVTMPIVASMVNGHRIAHGGYVFMLADTAFACACNSHGPVTVAAGADINFVAPARLGDVLVAEAVERARYGRNGICDVTVRREGELIAEFRGRSRTIGRDQRPAATPEETG